MSDVGGMGNYFVPHPRYMKASLFPIDDPIDIMWSAAIFVATMYVGNLWGDYYSVAWVLGISLWLLTMSPVFRTKDERLYYLILIAPFIELGYVLKKGYIWKTGQRPNFPYEVHDFGSMGLIYDTNDKSYSLPFKVKGSRVGTYMLDEQWGWNRQLADIIERASISTGLRGLEFTFGYGIRSEDPFVVQYMLTALGNVDAVLPEALVTNKAPKDYTALDERFVNLRTIANEMEEMGLGAAKPTMTVTVTVKKSRKFEKILKKGVAYSEDLQGQTLIQVRNTLVSLLQNVYEDPQLMNGAEAQEYLYLQRTANPQVYYAEKMEAQAAAAMRQQEGSDADDDAVSVLNDTYHAPQQYIRAHPKCLAMDGTYGTTFRLTEVPLDQPPVDYFRDFSGIFDIPALYFSVSITGRTKKGSTQYATKDASSRVSKTFREMSGTEQDGIVAEEAAMKEEAERRRLRANYTVDFVPRITILSDDRAQLEKWAREADAQLQQRQLGPARVKWRFRQRREVLPGLLHLP